MDNLHTKSYHEQVLWFLHAFWEQQAANDDDTWEYRYYIANQLGEECEDQLGEEQSELCESQLSENDETRNNEINETQNDT